MHKITTLSLGFSNALLIHGDDGAIMVDTGINVAQGGFVNLFHKLALDPQIIKLIIISHGHADHYAHANELKKLTRAPILCHKNAVEALRLSKNADIVPRNELGKYVFSVIKSNLPQAKQAVYPDIIIDSMMDLKPYGIDGKIMHTPGHTDCSISVVLSSGEAIVGDIIVPSFTTGEACIAYFATDEGALFQSLHKLIQSAAVFYGGHGGPFYKEQIIKLINV